MQETFRKLASVCTVDEIRPMANCDNICLCIIKGWQVVARKGEFSCGDKCVYVEIDSVLPIDNAAFVEFGAKPIKTRKIRGEISQGILFPLSILPDVIDGVKKEDLEVGTNVTTALNILKYDDSGDSDNSSRWPCHLPKTDEERIQNIFGKINNSLTFIETEKLDGTSFTAFLDKNDCMYICSRNYIVSEDHDLYSVAKSMDIVSMLMAIKKGYGILPMLQGECIGPKIQNNSYKLSERKVLFFRLYDQNTSMFVDYEKWLDMATALSIPTVPIVNMEYKLATDIKNVLEHVQGNSKLCASAIREGSVFVAKGHDNNYDQNRLSFKAISNAFLLKRKN
jgi:RNA ligase (TIGR02306 family)